MILSSYNPNRFHLEGCNKFNLQPCRLRVTPHQIVIVRTSMWMLPAALYRRTSAFDCRPFPQLLDPLLIISTSQLCRSRCLSSSFRDYDWPPWNTLPCFSTVGTLSQDDVDSWASSSDRQISDVMRGECIHVTLQPLDDTHCNFEALLASYSCTKVSEKKGKVWKLE